jgi:hypothetical protein
MNHTAGRCVPSANASLADLFVEAAAAVDRRQEQWECLRKYQKPRPKPARPPVAEMYRTYEETTGTVVGCD